MSCGTRLGPLLERVFCTGPTSRARDGLTQRPRGCECSDSSLSAPPHMRFDQLIRASSTICPASLVPHNFDRAVQAL